MNRRFLVSLIMMLITATSIFSQGMLQVSDSKIIKGNRDEIILRGMGLGGWMLQEGYMMQTGDFAPAQYQIREKITELIGEEDTQEFYDAWLTNYITKADVDSMAAWGFNSIRLPLHYNLFTLSIQDEPVEGENTW